MEVIEVEISMSSSMWYWVSVFTRDGHIKQRRVHTDMMKKIVLEFLDNMIPIYTNDRSGITSIDDIIDLDLYISERDIPS